MADEKKIKGSVPNTVVVFSADCCLAGTALWSDCSMNVVRVELECIIILILPYIIF